MTNIVDGTKAIFSVSIVNDISTRSVIIVYMNVDLSLAEPIATQVWFDVRTGLLCVEINGIVESIKFEQIAEEDFESATPIVKFSLGCEGTVIVCHHRDGEETWLPVDMWLPGGFTPLRHEAYQIARSH